MFLNEVTLIFRLQQHVASIWIFDVVTTMLLECVECMDVRPRLNINSKRMKIIYNIVKQLI